MLHHPRQIAYAVTDIRVAAAQWVHRGAGPFFTNDHIEVRNARLFGESGVFDHSSAYGQWGDVMIELICQHNPGPKPVVGTSGLHHLAFFVDDIALAAEHLEASGYPEALYGEAGSALSAMPFAMFDARKELGHLIEIYPSTDRLKAFYAMVKDAAHGWNGANPIRSTTN